MVFIAPFRFSGILFRCLYGPPTCGHIGGAAVPGPGGIRPVCPWDCWGLPYGCPSRQCVGTRSCCMAVISRPAMAVATVARHPACRQWRLRPHVDARPPSCHGCRRCLAGGMANPPNKEPVDAAGGRSLMPGHLDPPRHVRICWVRLAALPPPCTTPFPWHLSPDMAGKTPEAPSGPYPNAEAGDLQLWR